MDNLLDELVRAARRCERAAKKDPIDSIHKRLIEACQEVGQAWSGSWIGYHATVYIEGLRPRRPGEHFDSEWGGVDAYCSRSAGPWYEYAFEVVREEILRRAGVSDLAPLNETAGEAVARSRRKHA